MPGVSTWLMQRVSPAASNCQAPCLISSLGSSAACGAAAVAMAAEVAMSRRGYTERFKVSSVPGTHQHRPAGHAGRRAEHVVVLGEIVVVTFECRYQVRRCCRRVRELPGFSLLEPGHGQVTRAAEARGAGPVGADPERRQPAQRARAQKRDGIG